MSADQPVDNSMYLFLHEHQAPQGFTNYLKRMEESTEVVTTVEALHEYRKQIACSRLQNPGDAKDYCIVCALLECDPQHSMIGMVQCGTCHQWAHLECAKYTDEENYTCPKCL
ncbi:E3 ubiquitin-protein ligase SHPRH-like [Cololabis saira]|uniref:E3 ubiquitin-protein ligase SHPRH-like n=1 Tax=Cololabis saira TaxID=129043 RepID=UPI002AD534A4|nr:E3 ubiquitin-protein ligase SHPRH-like [Cololabis saira]